MVKEPKREDVFNFVDDEIEEGEIATSGNLDDEIEEDEIEEDPGPPKIHQGLTREQILDAQSQAGSPKGLDIAKFLNKVGLPSLDIDQLLSYRIPE